MLPFLPLVTLVTPCFPLLLFVTLCYPLLPFVNIGFIYENFSHIKKNVHVFRSTRTQHLILYRRCTEQFKLSFTDIHKTKKEYLEVR